MGRIRILLLVFFTSFALAAWSQAKPTVIVIDPLGAGNAPFLGTQVPGINTNGVVTGFFSDSHNVMHGFVRSSNGNIKTFDAPGAGNLSVPGFMPTPAGILGGQGTYPFSINPAGAIAGYYADSNNVVHGFVRAPDSTFVTFDVQGAGTAPGQGTYAANISPSGEILGYMADSANVAHGFVGDPINGFVVFEAPGGGTGSGQGTFPGAASSITPGGLSTGYLLDTNYVWHGWVRDGNGAMTTFEAPGAGTAPGQGTFAWSIGQGGIITAEVISADGVTHGFLRDKQGNFTNFDVPGAGTGPGQGTIGEGINTAGAVTGQYIDSQGANHGYIRDQKGNIVKFDAPTAGTGPGQGTIPCTLNPQGAIVGTYLDSNYVVHGFLRVP